MDPTQGSLSTAIELGSTVNAVDDGPTSLSHAVGCLEMRRSGLAPCCRHVRAEDPSLGEVSSSCSSPFGGAFVRSYIPPASLWDVPFTDPAHGVTVRSTFGSYQNYLDNCAEPLAPDDEVISDVVFFVLGERVDEAIAEPFPLAMRYPDGSDDPSWFVASAARGDVIGYGHGTPGVTSLGSSEGIRRVATSATELATYEPLCDPADPTSFRPEVWRFTADGGQFTTAAPVQGDGGDGADHVDHGAPWVFDPGGGPQTYALNWNGVWYFDLLYNTHLTPMTGAYVRAFFDPDGDGHLRGSRDGDLPDTIDADEDGLSEYREVVGTPGVDGCVAFVPPTAGTCWLPTNGDNCAPPPGTAATSAYQNPTQRDVDGDFVGDACDVCPEVWDPEQASCAAARSLTAAESPSGVAVRRGQPVGLACASLVDARDVDGDGELDAFCDNCVPPAGTPESEYPLYANQPDSDGDGVGDFCDICPSVANASQDPTDADADGVPDACDNCPPSRCAIPGDCANPAQTDDDGDSVGDLCDNCPGSACAVPSDCSNPDQANCNVDSERARASSGVLERGDACDPTPCPRFWPGRRVADSELGPSFTASSASLTGVPFAGPGAEGTLRSGFRFCECDVTDDTPEARALCQLTGPLDPNCGVIDPSRYEESDAFWHSPEHLRFPYEEDVDPTPGAEAVLRYASAATDQRPFMAHWDFTRDLASWGVPVTGITGLVERARGVIWGHGVEYQDRQFPVFGGPSPVVTSDPFGCPASASCSPADRDFTSHYWSGELERVDGLRAPDPVALAELMVSRLPQEICPVCRFGFPGTWLLRCGGDDLCIRWPEIAYDGYDETRTFAALEAPLRELLGERVETTLFDQLALDTELSWVAAAQPASHLGAADIHFVGVRAGGVVEIAAHVEDMLTNALSVSVPLSVPLGAETALLVDGRAAVAHHLVAGDRVQGLDLRSGDSWERGLTAPLGAVQSATLLDGAHGAFVVDTLSGQQRVLRIDLATGDVKELATFPVGMRDAHAVTLMPDGTIALLGWQEGGESPVGYVLRVEPSGTLTEMRRFDSALPVFGRQAHGSLEGLSFLVRDPELGWRPAGVALEVMEWVNDPGALAEAFQ